ncbi:MAG: TIR domain-containing protein [Pseudomonadota bacterium]
MTAVASSVGDRTARWAAGAGRLWRAFEAPLTRAPLSPRGLALGAALAVLLPLVAESPALGLWVAWLVGGGVALTGLAQALGWSEAAVERVGTLALVSGLVALIVLTATVTVDGATVEQLRLAVAFAAMGAVVLPYGWVRAWPQAALLLGPLAVTAWAAVALFAGSALVLLGITWPVTSSSAVVNHFSTAAVVVTWIAAFAANRFEATRSMRWAGRLLALRNGLTWLAGLVFAWGVALAAVPWLEVTAVRAAFNTPLEGIAPLAGVTAGVLLALGAALVFFALPGVFARLQLSGRCGVSAVGEASWGIALGGLLVPLLITVVVVFGEADDLSDVARRLSSTSSALLWMPPLGALTHACVRLLLGRPAGTGGSPLCVVLPGANTSAHALVAAEALVRAWTEGPVTLLANPALAPSLLGPHLRLAREASMTAPFARSASDVLAWRRDLPDEDRRTGLPLREMYASAPAATALLTALPKEARVCVLLDGPLAAGWDDVMAALPPHSMRVASDARFFPAGTPMPAQHLAPEGWSRCDFADPAERSDLLGRFMLGNRPRSAGVRHLLIVHGAADQTMARSLAGLLDGQTDATGRRVRASSLFPMRQLGDVLGLTPQAWASLFAFHQGALNKGEHPLPWVAKLWRAVLGGSKGHAPVRLDLAVLEGGFTPSESGAFSGPERRADVVLSMRPPAPLEGSTSLYDASAYTAHLTLPPASALGGMLPLVAQAILDEAFSALPDAQTGVPVEETAAVVEGAVQPEPTAGAAPEDLPEQWRRARTRVFVSHSHQALRQAQQLRDSLERHLDKADTCVYLDTNGHAAAVDGPRPVVEEALGTATHFVLLASSDYWLSAWCRRELEVATARHNGEGQPELFCVFADGTPEDFKAHAFHKDFRFLGPFDGDRRLVSLNGRDEASAVEHMDRLAYRFASAAFEGPPMNVGSRPIVLNYVREYVEYGEMLARALQMRGFEVEANGGLLEGEARLLYLSSMLVVLTGPAMNGYDGHPLRDADIALEYGKPVLPVLVAPVETTFALRENNAANDRYLSTLDPDELREEVERIADRIAGIASSTTGESYPEESPLGVSDSSVRRSEASKSAS